MIDNCPHSSDGWCLECVKELIAQHEHDLNNARQAAKTAIDMLNRRKDGIHN